MLRACARPHETRPKGRATNLGLVFLFEVHMNTSELVFVAGKLWRCARAVPAKRSFDKRPFGPRSAHVPSARDPFIFETLRILGLKQGISPTVVLFAIVCRGKRQVMAFPCSFCDRAPA